VFKLEECLYTKKVSSLRNAIVNFMVGGSIRRIQDRVTGIPPKKYSFIIHTEQNKASHGWQEDIIFAIKDKLAEESMDDTALFKQLVRDAYANLKKSITLLQADLPSLDAVFEEVRDALRRDYIMITKVNSEKDVNELLDDSGQLRLRTPLNIFIGGQILDRGITIGNLIGFYYGRRPKTFQQDTVLQHSRMYGARPIEDLTVTRFYTTESIYAVMKRIHEFDTALREAFEKGSHDNGVIFIQKDLSNHIIPCSPNKILLANTTTLKPVAAIDKIIENLCSDTGNTPEPFLMNVEEVKEIIRAVAKTYEEGHSWNVDAFLASLEYMTTLPTDKLRKGKVWAIVRRNRDVARMKADGRMENSPDSYQEKGLARQIATDIPAIVLLKQNGNADGWKGNPFYWPILVVPKQMQTVVFANDLYAD
jgi:hypothetical protein